MGDGHVVCQRRWPQTLISLHASQRKYEHTEWELKSVACAPTLTHFTPHPATTAKFPSSLDMGSAKRKYVLKYRNRDMLLDDDYWWNWGRILWGEVYFILTDQVRKCYVNLNRLMTYIYIYMCRTAPLTSRCFILYVYSTNIRTEYFKHAAHSPFFFLFKMPFIL